MMTWLVLLVPVIASVIAAPHEDIASNRLSMRDEETLPVSSRASTETSNEARMRSSRRNSERRDGGTKEARSVLLSVLNQNDRRDDASETMESESRQARGKTKASKRGRKRKAVFMDYPYVPSLAHYQHTLPNSFDYADDYYSDRADTDRTDHRTQDKGRKYQESDIFYIRLPPTPYAYVPGLGYVSQPPTYSTAGLIPRISNARPVKQPPIRRRPSEPFIELPIDFVSNGKPTSVYRWQKKPGKRPTDSPITHLDGLSPSFVNNGKPTSIHRWQTNSKPAKRPDDTVNELDKGPYNFNGKPTGIYILRPDGTKTRHRQILPPDYQKNIHRY